MIRVVLACSSLILGFCLGRFFAEKYKKRALFYKSIQKFNEDFCSELSFCKNNLKFMLLKRYQSEEFNQILLKKAESLENKQAFNLQDLTFLNENERYDVDCYFSMLGKSDGNTQLKILNGYALTFKNKFEECVQEQRKYGTLCQKTGLIFGLIAFVMVV